MLSPSSMRLLDLEVGPRLREDFLHLYSSRSTMQIPVLQGHDDCFHPHEVVVYEYRLLASCATPSMLFST
jgi:hypothetical protein